MLCVGFLLAGCGPGKKSGNSNQNKDGGSDTAASGGNTDIPVTPSDDGGGTAQPTDTTQTTTNAKGLVGHWKLDEASGTMASDVSDQLNHGTYAGAPTPSTNVPKLASANPQSLLFNGGKTGSDAVIVSDSDSLSLAGPFTLAVWVRPVASKEITRPQQGLIEKWEEVAVTNPPPDAAASAPANGYYLRLNGLKNVQIGIRNQPGMTFSVKTIAALADDTWTHVAAVYDGTSVILYINGAQDTTRTAAYGPTPGSSQLEIGRRMGFGSFEGQLDDVRIYDRALSAEEVMTVSGGG
jgi:hypothetical protein